MTNHFAPKSITLLAAKLALGSSLILGMSAMPVSVAEQTAPTTPASTCQEDEPCWDCTTMGNRQCGPEGIGIEFDGIEYQCTDVCVPVRDCTVTDSYGHRADPATECDGYWESGSYIGGYN